MSKEVLFISVFNLGGVTIALNHLESLRKQSIKNYRAYVTDQESYDIVKENGHPVELIINQPTVLTKDKPDFGTPDFNTFSYMRYKVIIELLEQNQPVWYLDIDTVALQNLNDVYDELKTNNYDAVMQNDINMLCSGCMLLFPKPNTIKVMQKVYEHRTAKEGDQIILMCVLRDNPKVLNVFPLNKMQFPNGLLYFNELHSDRKYREIQLQFKRSTLPVYFVHANWMIGMETKINALKNKGLWFL